MKSNELVIGNVYTDRDQVSAFKYLGTQNDSLYEFEKLEYDEEKGNYISTKNASIHYFNRFEITNLINLR